MVSFPFHFPQLFAPSSLTSRTTHPRQTRTFSLLLAVDHGLQTVHSLVRGLSSLRCHTHLPWPLTPHSPALRPSLSSALFGSVLLSGLPHSRVEHLWWLVQFQVMSSERAGAWVQLGLLEKRPLAAQTPPAVTRAASRKHAAASGH